MNKNTPPKLPDPDFMPRDWPEALAHFGQTILCVEHTVAEAKADPFHPVSGFNSGPGGRVVRVAYLLAEVTEDHFLAARPSVPEDIRAGIDRLLPRIHAVRSELLAML